MLQGLHHLRMWHEQLLISMTLQATLPIKPSD